jgi:Cu(I)/Ag(I) efflux system periplasmic protein CusF
MKTRFHAVALAIATIAMPATLFAQMNHDHSAQSMQMQATASVQGVPADGEVKAVDRSKGTLVIKHGPLVTLNMGPMTMEFVAKDPRLLANVKVGDRIRFTPEQRKDGSLIVTALEIVKT